MAEQETYLAILKASYDYEPQPDAEEELAIKENQLLFLLERTDDDWWRVKIKPESQDEDGPSGLVPAAYVEPAEHISIVKALYDYEATQSTELNVKEDEVLLVYDKDEEWLLVQSKTDESKVGYVPGNYVEETTGEEQAPASAVPSISQIVVPPSPPQPPRPVSVYIDPADRVAAAPKAQADDIQTWSVSEVDKKGKKKKGTLGVGNGAVFFASESDKTPVQKWPTSAIQSVKLEKSKHVHIDIGGADAVNLHFHAGSKDVGEAILAKLESSRALSVPARPSLSAGEEPERPRSAQKVVHFDAAEPQIIPPREPSEDGDGEEHVEERKGDGAVVLYDFNADGEDELSVHEGETIVVLERDSDEWWKCRNSSGGEGVVPASYVELTVGAREASSAAVEEDTIAIARAAQEEEERVEARRRDEEAREKAEREHQERESKKLEAERRAKAATAAAEADRKRREREREAQKEKEHAAAEEEEARRKKQRESTSGTPPSSPPRKSNGDAGAGRPSSDAKRGPPPENTRVWHDRTGQFRVEAAFLGFANGKLRLHKVNGVVIEVPSEKMSSEDLQYIENFTSKKTSPPRRSADDDDEPLEHRRRSLVPDAARSNSFKAATSAPKKPTVDWFEFFLSAGCDVDDCTRYASSFERDKIDEAILPDITESTMRSLGLREGDIIRVKKAIDQRQAKKTSALQEQLRRDEELARQMQSEENGSSNGATRTQPPNLFSGPNGALKTTSIRRGRPHSSKGLLPPSVDLESITTASGQIMRTGSPQVTSPEATAPPAPAPQDVAPVQPPPRSSSAMPAVSGFDDDAWTNRPSSTKPLAPAPPTVAPRAPSAPPAPASAPPALLAPAAAAPAVPAVPVAPMPLMQPAIHPPSAPATPAQPQQMGTPLAKTTDSDIFDQLARLSQMRNQSPAIPQSVSAPLTPSVPMVAPASYQAGLGMASSPFPMGQHLQAQQTGMLALPQPPPASGPRGPFAPVPANQALLQPLVPTTTGFNNFVPTRPQSAHSPFQASSQPMALLSTQPTGFPIARQPFMPQMTGFANPSPILSQPTGMPSGNFGSIGGGFGQNPTFLPNGAGFGQVQSNPTGFNPGFGQLPFNNSISSSPLAPPAPAVANTSPANVFAQMKSGTFANNDTTGPQSPDKYDALRPNPLLAAQPTGWGYTGMNGFQNGYGYQG